jgi:hypothetical protein
MFCTVRGSLFFVSWLGLAGVLLGPGGAVAQTPVEAAADDADSRPVQEVELVDGSRLYGRIVQAGDDVIVLELLTGDTLELPADRVRRVVEPRGRVHDGRFFPRDPNETRLFFAPTGRTVPRGDGYLSMYYIVMPFVGYGVTDSFTLAAGTPLLFGADIPSVLWLAPKVRVASRPGFDASVGTLAFFSSDLDDVAGVAFGVATFGATSDAAVTAGLGFGYAGSDVSGRPAAMLGAEARVSRSIKLITENYALPGGDVLLSAGPRFMGERLSADLALIWISDTSFVFPLINFVYTW